MGNQQVIGTKHFLLKDVFTTVGSFEAQAEQSTTIPEGSVQMVGEQRAVFNSSNKENLLLFYGVDTMSNIRHLIKDSSIYVNRCFDMDQQS